MKNFYILLAFYYHITINSYYLLLAHKTSDISENKDIY